MKILTDNSRLSEKLIEFTTVIHYKIKVQNSMSEKRAKLAHSVREYLHANSERQVTLGELSEHTGTSVSHIKKSFEALYGISPTVYIKREKMKTAARLLKATDLTVTDIAGQLGYDNASKFASVFKQIIGKTPSEYRKIKTELQINHFGAEKDSEI